MRNLRRLLDWGIAYEGSSRSSALIRIGLVMLMWARWAYELLLYKSIWAFDYTLLSIAFFISTILMFIGLYTRWSTLATAAVTMTMYHYFGYELGREPWTHHHTYLLGWACFLLAFTPAGKSYSLDRWLQVRRSEQLGLPPPPEHGNLLGLRLIALQLSLLYLWTAVDKSYWGFISGERLEGLLMWYYIGSNYPHHLIWLQPMLALISSAVVMLEFVLAPGMLFAPTRRWLVYFGILLHGGFYVLIPVYTYSATMLLLYLAYFDANQIHSVIERLSGHGNHEPSHHLTS